MWRVIVVMALSLFSSICLAREYRSIGVDKKIAYADAIAVVNILSIDNDYYSEADMRQTYAVAKIERILKNGMQGDTIKFITGGLTPEFNPQCCVVGGRYLIFVRRGYLVLESAGSDDDVFVAKEKDDFVSSADGPFGAYEIVDGKVLGWGNSSGANLDQVLYEIQQKLVVPTHSEPKKQRP